MAYTISKDLADKRDETIKRHGIAYVTFNVFGQAIRVSDWGPGTWISPTLIYKRDGSIERY